MKKIFIHNAFFRLLLPPVYGTLVYLLILLINNDVSQLSDTFMGQEVYFCIGLVYVLTEILRWNTIGCRKIFKDEVGPKVIMTQMVTGAAICFLVTSASITAYYLYVLDFSITSTELIIFNVILIVSGLLYNLIYFSNVYMYEENLKKLEEENDLTDALESDLVQFKNEVNPSLLYDSLETLITLIHKDEEESEEYIDNLSSVYRYILSHRKTEFSSLEKEVIATKKIVSLLNYRFDNNISISIKVDEDLMSSAVAPGTIPSLAECIIRGSIINRFQPLSIELSVESFDGYIVLQHKLNEKLTVDPNENHIFENIQKTYGFYTEKPVIKIKAYDQGYVKIPLLEIMEEGIAIER